MTNNEIRLEKGFMTIGYLVKSLFEIAKRNPDLPVVIYNTDGEKDGISQIAEKSEEDCDGNFLHWVELR